jgi:hypothetical protein
MILSIPKRTGTYADTLQAIGLADLVHTLGGEVPLIMDMGSEFQISMKQWKPENWAAPDPGYPYIWDSKKESKPPTSQFLDYRREVEKRDAAREASKANAKTRKRIKDKLQEQGLEVPDAPKPELALATILASMRKGWDGDRQLYRWLTGDRPRALLWTKQRLGVDGSEIPDPKWSNTQFLNPITGKGVHSPKTVARAANAINAALTDPFEDWLRLRAVFIAMLAYRDGEDFKLFVLEPAQASPAMLAEIATDLRKMNLWEGVKLDIHAVLRCTAQMIRHSDVMANGPVPLKGRVPRDVIAGLRQAYFKSLGTAAALMGDALFPLPDWFAVHTREDAVQMTEIIEEFIGSGNDTGCLGSLNESYSDDCATLQKFRNWLSAGSLLDFLYFHASFAIHLMQKRAKQEWNRPFSTAKLTILLSKGYDMNEIVTNSGFLSIARAIRNATIYSVGETARVKINTHFGLAQEWKQKLRAGNADFAAAVADFVQQYNWEVINRFNRQYHVVETTDLDELVRLIDSHGAEVIGLLLLAYGYAQAPKTEIKELAKGENA